MRMRMGRLQAVYKSGYDSEKAFIRKLLEAKGIEQCYEKKMKFWNGWEKNYLEELINNLADIEKSEDDLLEDDWRPVMFCTEIGKRRWHV